MKLAIKIIEHFNPKGDDNFLGELIACPVESGVTIN